MGESPPSGIPSGTPFPSPASPSHVFHVFPKYSMYPLRRSLGGPRWSALESSPSALASVPPGPAAGTWAERPEPVGLIPDLDRLRLLSAWLVVRGSLPLPAVFPELPLFPLESATLPLPLPLLPPSPLPPL
eukprot:309238-Prorocentrum_minimum.AAC.1